MAAEAAGSARDLLAELRPNGSRRSSAAGPSPGSAQVNSPSPQGVLGKRKADGLPTGHGLVEGRDSLRLRQVQLQGQGGSAYEGARFQVFAARGGQREFSCGSLERVLRFSGRAVWLTAHSSVGNGGWGAVDVFVDVNGPYARWFWGFNTCWA